MKQEHAERVFQAEARNHEFFLSDFGRQISAFERPPVVPSLLDLQVPAAHWLGVLFIRAAEGMRTTVL